MMKGANVAVPAAAVRVELGWQSGPGVPDADASAGGACNGRIDPNQLATDIDERAA